MCICYAVNPVYNFLTRPICQALAARQECGPILPKLQEGFFVAIQISFGGFILAFPVIVSSAVALRGAGLYRSEKQAFCCS